MCWSNSAHCFSARIVSSNAASKILHDAVMSVLFTINSKGFGRLPVHKWWNNAESCFLRWQGRRTSCYSLGFDMVAPEPALGIKVGSSIVGRHPMCVPDGWMRVDTCCSGPSVSEVCWIFAIGQVWAIGKKVVNSKDGKTLNCRSRTQS